MKKLCVSKTMPALFLYQYFGMKLPSCTDKFFQSLILFKLGKLYFTYRYNMWFSGVENIWDYDSSYKCNCRKIDGHSRHSFFQYPRILTPILVRDVPRAILFYHIINWFHSSKTNITFVHTGLVKHEGFINGWIWLLDLVEKRVHMRLYYRLGLNKAEFLDGTNIFAQFTFQL